MSRAGTDVMGIVDRASRLALELLFPARCALCDRGGALLCEDCAARLPVAGGRRCRRCWMPLAAGTGDPLCAHCANDAPAFASLRSPYVLEGGARRLAHLLKYEGLTSLAEPMARLMADRARGVDADLLVPVPLHRGRERARGYNQAAELGRRVAALAGLPSERRGVRRVRDTRPLVKTMHRDERREVMRGAFAGDAAIVDGRRILLVDDVVTTGATLDACSRALLEAGAAAVRCLTWARAD